MAQNQWVPDQMLEKVPDRPPGAVLDPRVQMTKGPRAQFFPVSGDGVSALLDAECHVSNLATATRLGTQADVETKKGLRFSPVPLH